MDKAEYINKYVKKVHDTVRLLSTVKTTVTVALRQVDKGMNDLHDELDALMPKDKEASTPPPVKKRKVVQELNLSDPSQFTWQEYYKKSDITLLKKEDYDKGIEAAANFIKDYEDQRAKDREIHPDHGDMHSAMRNTVRTKMMTIRVVKRGARYLAFVMLIEHHDAELKKGNEVLDNKTFANDIAECHRESLAGWRYHAVEGIND